MAIAKRLSKLFTADVHAVLDLIEEPHALLRQAIRDMDAEIQRQQQALLGVKRQYEQNTKRHTQQQAELEKLNRDLDLCFDGDNKDLIRGLIKKKVQFGKQTQCLERTLEALVEKTAVLGKQLAENQSRCEAMRAKSEQLTQRERETDVVVSDEFAFQVSEDEIEIALLAEHRIRSES